MKKLRKFWLVYWSEGPSTDDWLFTRKGNAEEKAAEIVSEHGGRAFVMETVIMFTASKPKVKRYEL